MSIGSHVWTRVKRGVEAALRDEPPAVVERVAYEAAPLDPRDQWLAALPTEVDFWRRWFATKGLDWPEDYRERLDPSTPLRDFVIDQITRPDLERIEILDIGAGPVTKLGYVWPGRRVRITAIDPIADHYDRILEEYGVVPPVRTTWCEGELLAERFAPDTFDLVWAQNSLDHSYDPVRIVESALVVAKPGSKVVLAHKRNEGETEKYEGLHQWNFCAESGDFVIWNHQQKVNVTQSLRSLATVRCIERPDFILVEIRKADRS
jgi:SAM-dependent methyltransferase